MKERNVVANGPDNEQPPADGFVVTAHLADLAERLRTSRLAVAVGVFDGVHRGHQAILKALHQQAGHERAAPIVLTFDPHPRVVLKGPEFAPRLLTPRPYQLHLFRRFGIAGAVILPFTAEFASLPPETFVRRYLLPPPVDLRAVCVGRDWRFGATGRGDARLLQQIGKQEGFDVIAVPPVHLWSRPVSSTRIREAVARGRLNLARRLLGRFHTLTGPVVRGRRIGSRVLECPTSNLDCSGMQLPPCGVYAGWGRYGTVAGGVYQPDSGWTPAAVYVGPAPTFRSGDRTRTEVHFLEATPSLYGKYVEAALVEFVRPDAVFDSVDALREQIRRDVARVRDVCLRTPPPGPLRIRA